MVHEQLPFPGFAPPATDRLFFALLPDAAAAEQAMAIAHALKVACRLKAKPPARRRLHVTLHHLGDHAGLPSEIVAQAQAAAAQLCHGPFDVHFDRAESFLSRRRTLPLVLRGGRVIPLIAFQHALGEALARAGLKRFVSPRYTPHMTLLYDARYVAARAAGPLLWQARDFVLIHSLLGRTRHAVLGRWTLAQKEGDDDHHLRHQELRHHEEGPRLA